MLTGGVPDAAGLILHQEEVRDPRRHGHVEVEEPVAVHVSSGDPLMAEPGRERGVVEACREAIHAHAQELRQLGLPREDAGGALHEVGFVELRALEGLELELHAAPVDVEERARLGRRLPDRRKSQLLHAAHLDPQVEDHAAGVLPRADGLDLDLALAREDLAADEAAPPCICIGRGTLGAVGADRQQTGDLRLDPLVRRRDRRREDDARAQGSGLAPVHEVTERPEPRGLALDECLDLLRRQAVQRRPTLLAGGQGSEEGRGGQHRAEGPAPGHQGQTVKRAASESPTVVPSAAKRSR